MIQFQRYTIGCITGHSYIHPQRFDPQDVPTHLRKSDTMDKKIAVIAVVAVAIVVIAACVLLLGKSSNPTFDEVEIDEELQGKFFVVNGDESESAVLEKGAKTYKDTKIVSEGVIWDADSIVIDHDALTVTATMVLLGGNHSVEISFTNIGDLDAAFVLGDLEIPLEGIKKGVSVRIDFDPPMPIEEMFAGTWNLVSALGGYYDEEGNPQLKPIDLAGKAIITVIDDAFCTLEFHDHTSTCVFDGTHLLTTDVGGFSSAAVISAYNGEMYIGFVLPGYGATALEFERESGPEYYSPEVRGSGSEPHIPAEGTVMEAFIAEKHADGETTDYLDRDYKLTILRDEASILFYKVDYVMDGIPSTFHFVAARMLAESYIAICDEPGDSGETFVDMLNFTDGVAYTSSYVIDNLRPTMWHVVYGDEEKAYDLEVDMQGWTYGGYERSIIYNGHDDPIETDPTLVALQVAGQENNLIEIESTTLDGTPALWSAVVLPYLTGGYRMTVESFALYEGELFTGFYLCFLDPGLSSLVVFGCLDGEDGSFAVFKQELVHTFG